MVARGEPGGNMLRNDIGVMPQGMDETLRATYVPATSPNQRFNVDSESLDATQKFDIL